MIKKLLGIGAGLAMGAVAFATPASAATVNQTTVGSVDGFLGSCTATAGGGIAEELACINSVLSGSFTESSSTKIESLNFMQVDWDNDGTLESATFTGSTSSTWDADDGIIWTQQLTSTGGWYSVKTGVLDCNGGGDIPTGCVPSTRQYLIFENLSSTSYATLDLLSLWFDNGFFLKDIEKVSHITVVPLPAAAFLFGSALLGGGLMRRRKAIKKVALPA